MIHQAVHAFLELQLQGLQLASQSLGTGEPQDHELALSRLPAAMREAKEVKGLRFALSRAAAVLAGKTPELDQPPTPLRMCTHDSGPS
ncbi:hypothetical protein [Rhodoferax sp.]|uniref:hypothetical protein n=1 Tax=Rhodoferax sp. TaxID=50421 RepID=UPI002745120B|nr:hypothetical protein [Rhodoferax sp.]